MGYGFEDALALHSALDGNAGIFDQGYANSSQFTDSVFDTIFPGLYGHVQAALGYEAAANAAIDAWVAAGGNTDSPAFDFAVAGQVGTSIDMLAGIGTSLPIGTSSQTPLVSRIAPGLTWAANNAGIAASDAEILNGYLEVLGRFGAGLSVLADTAEAGNAVYQGNIWDAAVPGAFAIGTSAAIILAPQVTPLIGGAEVIRETAIFGGENYEHWWDIYGPQYRQHECP